MRKRGGNVHGDLPSTPEPKGDYSRRLRSWSHGKGGGIKLFTQPPLSAATPTPVSTHRAPQYTSENVSACNIGHASLDLSRAHTAFQKTRGGPEAHLLPVLVSSPSPRSALPKLQLPDTLMPTDAASFLRKICAALGTLSSATLSAPAPFPTTGPNTWSTLSGVALRRLLSSGNILSLRDERPGQGAKIAAQATEDGDQHTAATTTTRRARARARATRVLRACCSQSDGSLNLGRFRRALYAFPAALVGSARPGACLRLQDPLRGSAMSGSSQWPARAHVTRSLSLPLSFPLFLSPHPLSPSPSSSLSSLSLSPPPSSAENTK